MPRGYVVIRAPRSCRPTLLTPLTPAVDRVAVLRRKRYRARDFHAHGVPVGEQASTARAIARGSRWEQECRVPDRVCAERGRELHRDRTSDGVPRGRRRAHRGRRQPLSEGPGRHPPSRDDDAPFSVQLEGWLEADRPKTLGELDELFGEKSFAVTIMFLMFLPALPLPTGGITHVFE